ncbi:MAG: hypothetical protein L0387_08345 [Acidobacteria bacterium]|nr:hypothetical protein [Acidobacteriota bacterium]MCI0621663.1 hypothetical protein [Acidobacteriota bacterium]MCI0722251.1 hypothetical protein [Acidobacteriota bacterium]
MKNAHLRLGSLEFRKWSEKSSLRIKVKMDRFIGEHPKVKAEVGRAHLVSVFGNDQDVSAVSGAFALEECFTVQGPEMPAVTVTLGKDPQTFRGSIANPSWRRPVRHLVAISSELAQTHLSDDSEYRRSIVCDSDPVMILHRVATRFGLPVAPDWTSWFVAELNRRQKIRGLLGIGCSPVVVYGTKEMFMNWIASALKKKQISIPDETNSTHWTLPDPFGRRPLLPSTKSSLK